MDAIKQIFALANDPKQTKWIAPLLLLGDAVLCGLIVWKIPYTEIDWVAYMQQVSQYIAGERDYIKIHGDTGPLVYPAAHVYIYRLLYGITDEGRNIRLAQYIFSGLYLATLHLVLQCYRAAKVPPWVLPLLVLSKRLHSIFLLRLFNDCFAVYFLFLAIYCYQRRYWTAGSLAYSLGLGVKMSLLLALPAIAIALWQGMGRDRALRQAMLMAQLQILLGYPFLMSNYQSYLSRAFEFSRQFLFKWTVNWRFVGEERFLSREFSVALLAGHICMLILFITSRWLQTPLQDAVKQLVSPPSSAEQSRLSRRMTPDFIITSILTAMSIGCLFARSLHYQFYAYIAWSTPFLLWRSGLHPILVYAICAVQEQAWNIYPSTDTSSIAVVGCLSLVVFNIWPGTHQEAEAPKAAGDRVREI